MAGGAPAVGAAGSGVRIVVAGDAKTGKSSLIVTAAAQNFLTNVPPVLPPTRLPLDLYPERVPVTIVDTSSSSENRSRLIEELTRADGIVLTYACRRPETINRLSAHWLPELVRLEIKVPVIVVGCRLDKRGDQQPISLEQVMSPIMQNFREIETCIESSASNRIQVKCFNAPLQPPDIVGVKRVVQDKLREGVDHCGLTLTGFLFLHALYIEKGRLETTWTVLRKFGYNNEIRLLMISCLIR